MTPSATPPEWPVGYVDAAAFAALRHVVPAREFVLKLRQDCNLSCRYCYVYEMPDQSWRQKPSTMTADVQSATVEKIIRHVNAYKLQQITLTIHGGEPMLASPGEIVGLVDRIRRGLPAGASLDATIQTNGTLVTASRLRALDQGGIRVGVSYDGMRGQDEHRPSKNGRGSSKRVVESLRLLGHPEFRHLFAGILSVVHLNTDPVACYENLLAFAPPALDFLLPHANWSTAPRLGTAGAYGDWLAVVFDRWYDAPAQESRIRLFEAIMSVLLGGRSDSEHVGLSPVAAAVVDTDGSIEQSDVLKSAYPDAPATGLSVLVDDFGRLHDNPGYLARQMGLAALADTCQECRLRAVCGGGNYAHRYRAGHGFRNPSVYCIDLQRLIDHIRHRLVTDDRLQGLISR